MEGELARYQMWSVVTKTITTFLGIVQGIIIIRILSPSDYGLVGIVLAVGGLIGISQHLGLATSSVREISVTKTLNEASKVIFTSLLIRLCISFPLAIVLFFASDYISNNIYHHPEISFFLKLFSLIIVLQGMQDIFAATLSGLQRFKQLFSFQIISSIISLILFVILVKYKGVRGYFFAMLIIALILFLILVLINFRIFREKFTLLSSKEFHQVFNRVFSVGLTIYILKILYIIWQKGGILIAGLFLLPKEIGYINFSLFLGLKTTFFTDAISQVNLPIMTKKYNDNFERFKREFRENFSKIFAVIFLGSIIVIFYSKEIITLLVGVKYAPSFKLIPFFIFSFLLYSLINIIGASIILPALMLRESIYYYLILSFVSFFAILILLFMGVGTLGVAVGMLLGAILAFVMQNVFIYRRIKIQIFDIKLGFLFLSLLPLVIVYLLNPNQIVKGIFFVGCLSGYFYLCKIFGIMDYKKILKLVFICR